MVAASPTGPPPEDARALPRRFGPYTLFEHVGRGGMAELFLARAETELGATRLVVVKLILPAFSDDPRFAEMLIHEAKLAAGLSHRHIVQVHDLGRDEDRLYIAMEYVEGFDLNALLRLCTEKSEGLPAEHALGIVADVLAALDYAHRRVDGEGAPLEIVHRDVSPSNVLISYDGEVKLCDFGIAHANDLVREEASEALKGKAGYMSPEHARAERLDARADVFAAGIILWELLAGRRLYKPRSEVPLLEQARRADIPPLPDKGLPEHAELERIVRRALAPNRDERYATAGAFQDELEGYLAKAGLLASRLKLGEWIAETFGTKLIEERRASECRLPKSAPPPPRPSGAMRARGAPESVSVPAAPRTPSDLAVDVTPEESVPLLGPSMGAFLSLASSSNATPPDAESSDAPQKLPERSDASLAGSTMDIEPSSKKIVDTGDRAASDAELIAWARKRGWVSFGFFFAIAAVVAIIWALTR
ncbi:MAG: serine/threonine protein kinase [Labilithrix sp.]|nr:serine/threonine protein kinase [Labilithrix sp.]